ncbi:MAG: hypothetical protein WBM97_09090, partial [Sedimenticolaceae bacterium]
VRSIYVQTRQFMFRYLSADHFLQIFRDYYGPVHKAFQALDEQQQAALADDIRSLVATLNRGKGGSIVVPADYLEIVITK